MLMNDFFVLVKFIPQILQRRDTVVTNFYTDNFFHVCIQTFVNVKFLFYISQTISFAESIITNEIAFTDLHHTCQELAS